MPPTPNQPRSADPTSFWATLGQGSIWTAAPGRLACLSRCVQLASGRLLCSFVRQAKMGINDAELFLTHSDNLGATWSEPRRPWPDGQDGYGVFASISMGIKGRLFLYGMRIPITAAGESFWQDKNQGIKQNELFFSSSEDDGRSWSAPRTIPMQSAGSAEAPGVLCITDDNVWLAPYAPYNTFDTNLRVQRNRVLAMRSIDQGKTWNEVTLHQFAEIESGGAEQWIAPLGNGRLVATAWHIDHTNQTEFPNVYSISGDNGKTWSLARSTGTMGNTTALARLDDGRALYAYVLRKPDTRGIMLSIISPTADDIHSAASQMIYEPVKATQSGNNAKPNEWTDFAFGEPSLTPLADGSLFITFWTGSPDFTGVQYLHLIAGM